MTPTPCDALRPARFCGSTLASVSCALALTLVLTACGNRPPAPDWALNAESAAERATQAYLRGDQRVQALEWRKARSEVERTGSPQLLARLALMRCAVEQASLEWTGCADFMVVAVDADLAEQAYARYLQALPLSGDEMARLPSAQQPVARALQTATQDGAAVLPVLAKMESPLSRLVAAGVVMRVSGPSEALLAEAVQTASSQGWRRPLLAWLLLSVEQAREAGKLGQVEALQRRVRVLEGQSLAPEAAAR